MLSTLITDLQQLREFSETLNLSKAVELINETLPQIETESATIADEDEVIHADLSSVLVNRIITSGTEILGVIHLKQNAGQMQQAQFDQTYQTSVAEIEALYIRKTEQQQRIDDAVERVKTQVQPLVSQLEEQIKKIPQQVIDSTYIQITELKKPKQLSDKLAGKISAEIQQTSQPMLAQIQSEIQRELILEAEQLQAFSDTVVQTMQNIEMKFVQSHQHDSQEIVKKGIALTTAVVARQSGIWSGYRVAGIKGVAVGMATASVSTVVSASLVTSLIGFTAALPAFIAISALSSLTGKWFLNNIFSNERLRKFKKEYLAQVQAAIKKQLASTPLSGQVNEQISNTFAALKQQVSQEVEALLEDTQNILEELQCQPELNPTFNEQQRVQLDNMRIKTQQIVDNAQFVPGCTPLIVNQP